MEFNDKSIENIISKVVKALENTSGFNYSGGVFETPEEAVEKAFDAQKELSKCTMSQKDNFIKSIRKKISLEENILKMSKMAVEETGMGNITDKILKNKLAITKTPGIEDLTTGAISGDYGLTLINLSPFGVICAITPTTNPTETIISNAIGMIAAGNSVVFCPHPRGVKSAKFVIGLIGEALEEVNAPKNLIVTINRPSIEATNTIINSEKIKMIVATGGPGIVKSVLSSGKKAIGAGAGNPPVVVDETADIEKAAQDIIKGCSFDNNVPCIAEKEVIAVDSITDYLMFNMKKNGAYELTDNAKIEELKEKVTKENGMPKPEYVGKSAKTLLNLIGIEVDDSVKVIIMERDKNHTFVKEELMMPILPIVRAKDCDEAIDIAVEVENGNRHTAIMHSKNIDKLTKMAKLIQTTIFVKNGPSYAGIGVGGEGFSTFTIAGPTGEGLTSARSFARTRRCVLVEGFNIR